METQKQQKLIIPIAPCVLQRLNYFLQTKKIPHLLFHGKSGTGKRTIVNQFIREILDHDQKRIENNVLYVNCAHEKGIQFIRCEIKNFARINVQYIIPTQHTQHTQQHTNQKPKSKNEMFKIIVLQNADKLTIDAQSALRRSIEIYSNNTRFFIIVENIQKILNPILSRFCEIYVPERMDTQGNTICLHQLPELLQATSNPQQQQQQQHQQQQQETQHLILSFLQEPTPHKAISVSTLFYEEGLSCYELLNTLKPMMRPKHFSSVEMEFQKIKSEFRCEKLLVFYLLIFLTTLC